MKTTLDVLVIEDNAVDGLVITKMLKKHERVGVVTVAKSIGEAKASLETQAIDLVISDYYLPDGDAFSIIKSVGKPVILMTASQDEKLIDEASKMQDVSVIQKDFNGAFIQQLNDEISSRFPFSTQLTTYSEIEGFMEHISDLLTVISTNGGLLYANSRWSEVTGYEHEQIKELTIYDLLHKKYHEVFISQVLDRFSKEADHYEDVFILLHASGRKVKTRVSFHARRDESGALTAIQSVFRDPNHIPWSGEGSITARRKFNKLIEFASDLIYELDYKGRLIQANDLCEDLTGYTKQELTTMTFQQLIYAEDLEKVSKFYFNQVENKIEFSNLDFRIITKQKEVKWVSQSVTLLLLDDAIDGFLGICRNVNDSVEMSNQLSAYKESVDDKVSQQSAKIIEDRDELKSLLDSIDQGLIIVDPTTLSIEQSNESILDMLGFKKLVGKRLDELFSEQVIQELTTAWTEENGSFDLEFEYKGKSEEKRLQVVGKALTFREKIALLLTVRDITEEKKTYQKLQEAKKRRFAAIIDAQEAERRRYAHILHEDINQLITVQDHAVTAINNAPDLSEEMKSALALLNEGNHLVKEKIKYLTKRIMPPALVDFGLVSAIKNFLVTFEKEYNAVDIEFISSSIIPRLDPSVEVGLYRIITDTIDLAVETKLNKLKITLEHTLNDLRLSLSFKGNHEHLTEYVDKLEVIEERASIIGTSFNFTSIKAKGDKIIISLPYEY